MQQEVRQQSLNLGQLPVDSLSLLGLFIGEDATRHHILDDSLRLLVWRLLLL